MKGDLANNQLLGSGLELERSLNRLTAQAELAVQDSDPVHYFQRQISSSDSTGKNDTLEV